MKLFQLTVRVPHEVARWLEDTAAAREVSVAEVAREILANAQARERIPTVTGTELVAQIEAEADEETRRQLKVDLGTLRAQLVQLEEERAELADRARNAATTDLARSFDDAIHELDSRIAEVRERIEQYEATRARLRARLAAKEVERLAPTIEAAADELGTLLNFVTALAPIIGDTALPSLVWSSVRERLHRRAPAAGVARAWLKTGNVVEDLKSASPAFARATG